MNKKSIFTLASFSFLLNSNISMASEHLEKQKSPGSESITTSHEVEETYDDGEFTYSLVSKGILDYDPLAEKEEIEEDREEDNEEDEEKISDLLYKLPLLPSHYFEDIFAQKEYYEKNEHILNKIKNIISKNKSDNYVLDDICSAIDNEIVEQFSLSEMFNVLLFDTLPYEHKINNFIKCISENYQFLDWSNDKKTKFIQGIPATIEEYENMRKILKQNIINELFDGKHVNGFLFDILSDKYKQEFILDTFNYVFKSEYECESYREKLLIDLILNNQSKFKVPIYNILNSLDLEKLDPNLAVNVRKILRSIKEKGTIKKEDINLFKRILQYINR